MKLLTVIGDRNKDTSVGTDFLEVDGSRKLVCHKHHLAHQKFFSQRFSGSQNDSHQLLVPDSSPARVQRDRIRSAQTIPPEVAEVRWWFGSKEVAACVGRAAQQTEAVNLGDGRWQAGTAARHQFDHRAYLGDAFRAIPAGRIQLQHLNFDSFDEWVGSRQTFQKFNQKIFQLTSTSWAWRTTRTLWERWARSSPAAWVDQQDPCWPITSLNTWSTARNGTSATSSSKSKARKMKFRNCRRSTSTLFTAASGRCCTRCSKISSPTSASTATAVCWGRSVKFTRRTSTDLDSSVNSWNFSSRESIPVMFWAI